MAKMSMVLFRNNFCVSWKKTYLTKMDCTPNSICSFSRVFANNSSSFYPLKIFIPQYLINSHSFTVFVSVSLFNLGACSVLLSFHTIYSWSTEPVSITSAMSSVRITSKTMSLCKSWCLRLHVGYPFSSSGKSLIYLKSWTKQQPLS